MARQLISSGSPFEAIVGYSRAVVQGDWCFVAGTTGGDPDTGVIPHDVLKQTENALSVVQIALDDAGFEMAEVVRATYYITDMAFYDMIAPALGAVFGKIRPAATMVVVAGLIRPEMKVEIEVTAFRG